MRIVWKPRVRALEEGRVRRQRQERRAPPAQLVGNVDARLGVLHLDVDVHPEGEIPPREVLQLLSHPLICVGGHELLILPARERVHSADADRHAKRGRDLEQVAPQRAHPGHRLAQVRRLADVRLDHRVQELVPQPLRELGRGRAQHPVDDRRQVAGLRVAELKLLLHPQRERVGRQRIRHRRRAGTRVRRPSFRTGRRDGSRLRPAAPRSSPARARSRPRSARDAAGRPPRAPS